MEKQRPIPSSVEDKSSKSIHDGEPATFVRKVSAK